MWGFYAKSNLDVITDFLEKTLPKMIQKTQKLINNQDVL